MRNDETVRLYKYRSLAGEFGRIALEKALLQSQLYWQNPVAFNDPFDCLPVLYFGDNELQRRQFMGRAATALCAGSRSERRRKQREMSRVPPRQMERRLRAEWPQWLTRTAVSCFSELPDHPLLWGHYADSHRGVCLVFNEIATVDAEWFAFPVSYGEARPRVNLTKFNDPDIMMSALFHKSSHWSYEAEQRMLKWDTAPGYQTFPQQALVGIILGAKLSDEDSLFVNGLLAKRPHLEVYRAIVDEAEFKLNIVLAE